MTKKYQLRVLLNLGCLEDLPEFSVGPRLSYSSAAWLEELAAAGYVGIQTADPEYTRLALDRGLVVAGEPGKRIDCIGDIYDKAKWAKDTGLVAMTAHVGTGFEKDDEAFALFEDLLNYSEKINIAIYPETHRATLLQDPYRCLRILEKFPEMRLNGDFSHWYTGVEMVYGDFQQKLVQLDPVFAKIRFIHGRISNSGHIQAKLSGASDPSMYVEHFRQFWTKSFAGFVQQVDQDPAHSLSKPNSLQEKTFYYVPELLSPKIFYAYPVQSEGVYCEESDRWEQALLHKTIAESCFEEALLPEYSRSIQDRKTW